MSLVCDVSADQPLTTGRLAVQELTPAEVASLAEELVAYHQHFAPLFYRREQRDWAAVYLRGLLTADVPRKNVEAMALRLLGVGPHAERQVRALQQFIGEGRWDDEAILAEHQRLVNETLGEEDGVLNTLGSDFPKHGDHSAGVAPQWCGNTGKKDNCQAGVFLGYASRKGATLLDRRLYLPESWFDESAFRPNMSWQLSWSRESCKPGSCERAGWSATRGMATRPRSWRGWTRQGCGIWQRCREIPRFGHWWKPMGKRIAHVRAAGCRRKRDPAKDRPHGASDCIRRVRPK